MSGIEIRKKIDENNAKIREELRKFILTDVIKEYMEDNYRLRAQCEHHYVDGVCEYCDGYQGEVYDD